EAEGDERGRQQDRRGCQEAQTRLHRRDEPGGVQPLEASVAELELPPHGVHPTAHVPDLLRERALCEREQDCEPSRENGDAVDRARDGCISTHEREATPREPEPDVRVEAAPGELEVVGEDEKDPDGNENEEPGAEAGGADEADRAGGSDRGYGEP